MDAYMNQIQFDDNGHPFLELNDIVYRTLYYEEDILGSLDEFATKLATNDWRKYMDIKAEDLKEYLKSYAKLIAEKRLSVVAYHKKLKKGISYSFGLDYFENTDEIDKGLPEAIHNEKKFFHNVNLKVEKYLRERYGITSKNKGLVIHYTKGCVLDSFEGQKVIQILGDIHGFQSFMLGYKYLISEPSSPKTQHLDLNSEKNYDVVDYEYFQDYEKNGVKFIAPKTPLLPVPCFVTLLIDIAKVGDSKKKKWSHAALDSNTNTGFNLKPKF